MTKVSPSDWKDKRVLVTGGAGFLGSHLVETLVSRGARVTVLDCLDGPPGLKGVNGKIQYLKADVTVWTPGEDEKFDFIFHLAAFAFPRAAQENPDQAFRLNVTATVHMLEVARKISVKKFIFPSAGLLYTSPPQYLPIDEKHPIDPSAGVYATTKRIGELLCDDYRKNYGVPCLTFRLFNTYGPRQSADYLVASFFRQGLSKGSLTILNDRVRRDFTFVGDMVEALLKGAETDYTGGPINLGSGVEHSIGEVARKIADLLKIEKVECLNQKVFGAERHFSSNRLAREILNWQPSVSLEEGLRLTCESFKEQFVLTQP